MGSKILIELAQHFSPGRTSGIGDVIVNALGVFSGDVPVGARQATVC